MRTTIGALSALTVLGLFACTTETIVRQVDTTSTPVPGGPTVGTPTDPDPSQVGNPTDPDSPSPPLVDGLAITEVAFLQGVKVSVAADGKAIVASKRNAPVVVGRPGLVRVYVKPGTGYAAGEVTAELRLVDGTTRLPILRDTKTITKASLDEDTKTTFNFEVPATSLPAGVTYQVFLTAKNGTVATGSNDARFPKDGGVQDLEAETSGKLKIVVVPVQYEADGSGRTPDVSAAQLERYQKTFMARYAASEVEVTARAPYVWESTISANGGGFSQVLDAITSLRRSDGVAADVYYYGALAPTQSFDTFCGRGCVTGLSSVVQSPKTSFLRASVGVGFAGQDSVNTAAHEVGHAHGRNHAPCGGASGVDASFPYSNGSIGVWGYNIFDKTLISPTRGRDMMGYCPNEWVSDYTFTALFDRIAALNGNPVSTAVGESTQSATSSAASNHAPAAAGAARTQTFQMATVAPDGSTTWTQEIELDEEPTGGDPRLVTYESTSGSALGTRTAQFYPYDHLPGGVLVMPKGAADAKLATWASVRVAGLSHRLTRSLTR